MQELIANASGRRAKWHSSAFVALLALGSLALGTACPKKPEAVRPEPVSGSEAQPVEPQPEPSPKETPAPSGAEPVMTAAVPPVVPPEVSVQPAQPEPTPAAAEPEYSPPESFDAAMQSAAEHLRQGSDGLGKATKDLEVALSLNPRSAEAQYNSGLIYHQRGDLAQAEKAYRKAVELKPATPQAWANLAAVHRSRNELTDAMSVIDTGLVSNPDHAVLLNAKAATYSRMGKNDLAIEEVRKILKINAKDLNTFNNLGVIYIGMKDYEMAKLVFEKALQTVPDAKQDPYIHQNMGVALLGLGEIPAAQLQFDEALKLRRDLVEALINRAYLHLQEQEFEPAAELLRRAVALVPANVPARLNLGVALRGLGPEHYERARLQYEEALRLEPKNVSVLWNYGVLLGDYTAGATKNDLPKAIKTYEDAIVIYQRLRDLTPTGPEASKVDRAIKEAQNNLKRAQKQLKVRSEPTSEGGTEGGSKPPAEAPPAPSGTTSSPAPTESGASTNSPTPTPETGNK